MDNEKKCDKYEGLFVFRSEEELKEHLKECPDCQKEHEKQLKVSSLVKEVAPVYLAKRKSRKTAVIRNVACFAVIFSIVTTFAGYKVYDEYNYQSMNLDDT